MKLLVVAVGQRQPAWADTAWADFAKRFPPELRLELRELKAEPRSTGRTAAQCMAAEAQRFEAALAKEGKPRRVVLDERGTRHTTLQLAERLRAWRDDGRDAAMLVGGWVAYDLVCRSKLGENEALLGVIGAVALAVVAYVSCKIFSGRGAFLQVGAMTGTIMVANVAMVIIPGQRKMVAAMSAGATPDPKYGRWGKQRSVHNTYLTLPVIFIMISPHYPMTWQHPLNWLILLVIGLAGALVRQYFVLRQQGRNALWLPAGAVTAMVAAFFIVQSGKQDYAGAEVPAFTEVQAIVAARCANCHAARPSFEGIAAAPKGVIMETPAQIRRWAASMRQQVQTEAMPPGNMTEITAEERAKLIAWVAAGAPLD
jgi:rRNA large subunit m3Psi methyltransferase RlmH